MTVDYYLLSHRLPIALALKEAGFEVTVVCTDTGRAELIRAHGLRFVEVRFSRSYAQPFHELRTILALARVYFRTKPDLIHHVALKAVTYGSLAARVVPSAAVVNAISGLGFAFALPGRNRTLKWAISTMMRISLRRKRTVTIFQNPDDLAELAETGPIDPRTSVVIRGSGVDLERFRPSPVPSGPPMVLMASRLLWDKGVAEFVEAARILSRGSSEARFVLAGSVDPDNRASASDADVARWVNESVVEAWGERTDIEKVLTLATLVVLPSYREGLPKILLEAAATGRPLIATDVPGCREVVKHEKNGLLVPARDAGELAAAILRLLELPADELATMGRRSRELVEDGFSVEAVVEQTLSVYRELLGPKWPE